MLRLRIFALWKEAKTLNAVFLSWVVKFVHFIVKLNRKGNSWYSALVTFLKWKSVKLNNSIIYWTQNKNKGYKLVTLDLCIITRTITSFVLRILLCFFQESSRPSPLPIDFRVSEKELVNQYCILILGFPGIKLQSVIRRLSPTTEDTHKKTSSV